MPLITIIITLVIAGVLLWAINTYIPMAGPIKKNPQSCCDRPVAAAGVWYHRKRQQHPGSVNNQEK